MNNTNKPWDCFASQNKSELFKIISILSLLFTLFYLLYLIFSPAIHHFYPPPDKSLFNPWIKDLVAREEGIEMWVMTLATTFYLLLSYLIITRISRLRYLSNLSYLAILPSVVIILMTRPMYTVGFSSHLITNLLIILVLPIMFFITSKLPLLAWITLGGAIILSASPAKAFDYGYYIGPALKLLQGERLGSFYLQYNLAGIYLFKWMMQLGLQLAQMQLVLGLMLTFWFGLYYSLARKLIKDRFLVYLFMIALVIIRFLAIHKDPVFIPQVTPIRIELWVPLMFVLYKFGFRSFISAFTFALVYIMDSFFGLMYLGLYLVFLIRYLGNLRYLGYLIPAVLGVVFHLYFFGSITSSAGQLYSAVGLGFLPIYKHSLFWPIFAAIPICIYLILKEKDKDRKKLSLFLIGLTLAQLVYFFGRSHDHNLLNISGVWLLVLFISLDKLTTKYLYLGVCIFILFSALAFADQIENKFERITNKVSHGVILENHSLDTQADKAPDLFADYRQKEKIVLMSSLDSYLIYRYKLKQIGYFAPFPANIYLDQTAEFLQRLIKDDYKVIFWGEDMLDSVTAFNQSRYLTNQGLKFDSLDKGNFSELTLAKADESAKEGSWLKYTSDYKFSFRYPAEFTVSSVKDEIRVEDNRGIFMIIFQPDQETPGDFGKLVKQGSADIPTVDKAYVKIWEDNGVKKLEFFLTKGENKLKVLVWPADSEELPMFNRIINTLNFSK